MTNYRPADWGADADGMLNSKGKRLFKQLVLNWSEPIEISKGKSPFFEDSRPLLYAIIRDHRASKQRDKITYIGLSTDPNNRFHNHPTARNLIDRAGTTKLSFAFLDMQRSPRIHAVKRALEDVEHILIWALWKNLENKAKFFALPGMGSTVGDRYHIINEGYQFLGQMPKEIVYPWMLVKNRVDKSRPD